MILLRPKFCYVSLCHVLLFISVFKVNVVMVALYLCLKPYISLCKISCKEI